MAFHFDDFWLWGERIYGLNLMSDTVLTFLKDNVQVELPIPRRSLYCMRGDARFQWQHGIKGEHIIARRMVVTLRELPEAIRETEVGARIVELSENFV